MTRVPFSASKNASTVLQVERLPARLLVEDVAALLGFQKHDIRVLVSHKLLKPLGNPSPAATKHFATVDIQEYAKDTNWLSKATRAVYENWKSNNADREITDDELLIS